LSAFATKQTSPTSPNLDSRLGPWEQTRCLPHRYGIPAAASSGRINHIRPAVGQENLLAVVGVLVPPETDIRCRTCRLSGTDVKFTGRVTGKKPMIAALIAMLILQPQLTGPIDRALVKSNTIAIAQLSERQRKLLEARELLNRAKIVAKDYAPTAGRPTRAELNAAIDQMKNDLDSMLKVGEYQSFELQLAMERMSKMMSTLSNLLKKISDTQSSIVQNIK
jgi:hypothetical protein